MSIYYEWLQDNNINNPHLIPEEFKDEYENKFGDTNILWPQPGGQEEFLSCPADIVLYGGEAGGGKSWCLSYEHMKWINIPEYEGVIVRKTFPQIFGPGGLWSKAQEVFQVFGGRGVRGSKPAFKFPSGAKVYFMHSQHASKTDVYWQGLEVPYIGIDELTQFEKDEFLYIMSRNRSTTGISSYIRATCNPDPNSWVRDMIDWWIDEDGYIIKERCGIIRYFVHRGDRFVWGDTKAELVEKFGPKCKPKSFTFIRGHLAENKMLTDKDPEYEASLQNLSEEQRLTLCEGNWNNYDDPKSLFKHSYFNKNRVEKSDFSQAQKIVIAVDPCGSTSATSDDCGIVVAYSTPDGHAYVTHDMTGNWEPNEWAEKSIMLYDELEADEIYAENNFGGQMVKNTVNMMAKELGKNYVNVVAKPSIRGKFIRAEEVSSMYKLGLVHHVGYNLKPLEKEMASFKRSGQTGGGSVNGKSPNRLDAAVFAITRLLATKAKRVPRLGVIR